MSTCPRCGKTFGCGMAGSNGGGHGGEPCWCTRYPILPRTAYQPDKADPAASRCFCPDCLRLLHAEAQDRTG